LAVRVFMSQNFAPRMVARMRATLRAMGVAGHAEAAVDLEMALRKAMRRRGGHRGA